MVLAGLEAGEDLAASISSRSAQLGEGAGAWDGDGCEFKIKSRDRPRQQLYVATPFYLDLLWTLKGQGQTAAGSGA